MKKFSISLLLLSQIVLPHAFAEPTDEKTLLFEGGAKDPKPFKPFEATAADGSLLPLTQEAILTIPATIQNDVKKEATAFVDKMKADGFDALTKIGNDTFEPIKTSVGAYVKEFNESEEKLNKLGYTLRETTNVVVTEVQKISTEELKNQVIEAGEVYVQKQLDDMKKRAAELDKQLADVKARAESAHKLPDEADKQGVYLAATKDSCGTMNASASTVTEKDAACFANDLQKVDTSLLQPKPETCAADTPLGKTRLIDETWSDGGGDKNFGWNANATFNLTTDAAGVTAKSSAVVNGLIIGKKKAVLEASANFTAPRTGHASSQRSISIFGNKTSSKNETFSTNLVSSKNAKGEEELVKTVDQNLFSQTFPVGFVPVLVTVDTRYTYGPQYSLDIVPVKIVGKAEWVNKFTVIASAGVGADLKLFIILAGIKGHINLINSTVGIYPEVGLYLDEQNRPQIGARLTGLAALETLSGQIDLGVWAKTVFSVPQPKKSFPYVDFKPLSYEWKQTIGKYPGYKFPTATLFDQKVGYDVCSGRKQVEVLTPNLPRPRDERESFAIREEVRISALEGQLRGMVSENLGGDDQVKVDQALNEALSEMSETPAILKDKAVSILGLMAN